MEQKIYGACEKCGANIAAGHYAHCPHYVSQKRDLTELNKRLRAIGGKVDCNDVQDELQSAKKRIAELEGELAKAVTEAGRLGREFGRQQAERDREIARLREALRDAARVLEWGEPEPKPVLIRSLAALENGDE